MGITYTHGIEQVQALAQQAGKAQAAKVQLDMRFKKDMAMMDYQFKLAAEQRSRSWDLEKMEIASRNDFQQEEVARVKKQEEWSLVKKQIEGTDFLSDDQKKKALYENYMKFHGGVVPKQKSVEEQIMEQAFAEQQGGQPGTPQGARQQGARQQQAAPTSQQQSLGVVETPEGLQIMGPDGAMKPLNQSGMVHVINPDGEKVKIKASQLREAIGELGYQFIGVASSSIVPPTRPAVTSQTQKDSSFDFQDDIMKGIFGAGRADFSKTTGPIPGVGFGGAGYNPNKKSLLDLVDLLAPAAKGRREARKNK
jgi:hypothetical protein